MITAALVGNPNVGKSTLFNLLTGSDQYVGNWAGVTVERKEGYLGDMVKIVDLPGIYGLDTYSNEEKVSKQFLKDGNVDVILNIVDASNLERNLYLTIQLKQFKKPVILVINMMDTINSKGLSIDCDKLSERLGTPVVPISASKKKGTDNLKELLYGGDFFRPSTDNVFHLDSEKEIYNYIEDILKSSMTQNRHGVTTTSDRLDRIFLNKVLAYPIFILILFMIFKFTFTWVGQPLSDIMDSFINGTFTSWINRLLQYSDPWFRSLIVHGIIGGVGAVIIFLPVILSLFLGISFLEDSGYMARAAFIMDKIMRKMGLSGKAFIPLVIGFGCSVPGIMAARTLESEKDRKLTALIVPLMSCNARLPVYALFASVFFPGNQTVVVFSLYILGIIMAFIVGFLFKNTIFKKDEEPFLIELPEYRMPAVKDLLFHTWRKGRSFLIKMGTIIFSSSVIVWFLSSFNFSGLTDIDRSFLSYIGKFISPVFTPLGFGVWQNSVSLLTGIIAKEVIVGTMGVLYGSDLKTILPQYFSQASAYGFLVFVLLYTPCISVIGTMRKEFGKKIMRLSVFYQVVLAWAVSFIAFKLAALLKLII